jgi:hypothetical protein
VGGAGRAWPLTPLREAANHEAANMSLWVVLSGLAVAAIGLLGLVLPRRLVEILARFRFLTGLPVTVGVRLGFGALFVAAAPACRLPECVRLIGFLELAGGLVLIALGAERLRRFVEWWLARTPSFVRCWCLAAVVFGIALAYAGAAPEPT